MSPDQDAPRTRTFENEALLPRVPLPSLEDSCDRFLEWCRPLLTAEEAAETEQVVASALGPDSPLRTLQAALEQHEADNGTHTWLDDFWSTRYLGRRDRTALNANFFFLFQDAALGQVERAARLLTAAVRYKLQVDAERLPPGVSRGQPLSMEQVRYLFSATRIPGERQDTVRTAYSPERPGPSAERHVVVLHRGHAFALDVVDVHGEPHSVPELVTALHALMAAGAVPARSGTSVGHLTTQARAAWAADRQSLLACGADNVELLETVESALLCVCLEDAVPADAHEACDQLLHGDSGNRWFDKALSLVVFGDGTAGLNVEHSMLDGTTVLDIVDALVGEAPQLDAVPVGQQSAAAASWRALRFELDEHLKSQVRDAAASFAAYATDTATTVLSFEHFGSEAIKQLSIAPDAFVQMAYQLAHRRTRGRVGATYESIATRQFRHGRTEAMRVVTPQVIRFVRAMDDPQASSGARVTALQEAADVHSARARACRDGHAPEQHLWELQLTQQRRGQELGVPEPPALYGSPGWLVMRDDHLSTSSAPSTHIQYFGFGSTGASCIGIAYVLLPDRFNLYLSSPRAIEEQLAAFTDHLASAVRELQGLLAAPSS